MRIKNVSIVSVISDDELSYYSVGVDGVTAIKEETIQVSTDKQVSFYMIYRGKQLHAKISALCPVEVVYEP